LVAEVIDNTTSRGRTLRFLFDGSYEEFRAKLTEMGETPLPKYIDREPTLDDAERYQTIFASVEGAVAAPVAGLHFSKHLMKRLEIKGIHLPELTHHVGLGTFRPVEVEDLSKHKMDSEQFFLEQPCADVVNNALLHKRRVCAIGTTTVRTLESSLTTGGRVTATEGWTNKFLFPPYEVQIPDSMVTNFHPPGSTLLMMNSAMLGHDLAMHSIQVAIKEKYRFLAFGDAMLII
jgi:S-adenosylmethionine:tRNA ribosyltransferase-isomerase